MVLTYIIEKGYSLGIIKRTAKKKSVKRFLLYHSCIAVNQLCYLKIGPYSMSCSVCVNECGGFLLSNDLHNSI